jgi:hypothetical protein
MRMNPAISQPRSGFLPLGGVRRSLATELLKQPTSRPDRTQQKMLNASDLTRVIPINRTTVSESVVR